MNTLTGPQQLSLNLRAVFVAISLVLGPVIVQILYYGSVVQYLKAQIEFEQSWLLIILRNFVIAPAVEEFIYRVCITYLLQRDGFTNMQIILLAPQFFGFSHLHHLFGKLRVAKLRSEAINAVLGTLLQYAYTSVFGMIASQLYLRTQSFLTICVVHSIYNIIAFPDVYGDLITDRGQRVRNWSLYIMGVVVFSVYIQRV
ncbi:hypothetical protein MP228_012063 [Amoeboaphelidium protococcarum]|nr:hypothetical protein MP228_012063 [Amoeboaphelidium protococcarum]